MQPPKAIFLIFWIEGFMLKRKLSLTASLGLSLFCANLAHAGLVNDVPSCYEAYHLEGQQAPKKVLYVLVDQTVQLDNDLKRQAEQNVDRMIQPGSRFVIAQFSAFSQGRYLQILHTGVVESPPPESVYDDVPITKAPKIKQCFEDQKNFARRMAIKSVAKAMSSANNDLAQSDILAALKNISKAISEAPESDRVLFLISDALENSSVTSFYASNTVRRINPDSELKKVKNADLLGDFKASKVYMLGSGVMPASTTGSSAARHGYRDPKTMLSLQDFWRDYFEESHATLVEFGAPSLVNPVAY